MLCDRVLLKFSLDFPMMLPEEGTRNTVREQEMHSLGLKEKNSLEKQIPDQCPSSGRPFTQSLQP